MMCADCSAATSGVVDNGQARRAMLVEFPARIFNRLTRATTSGRGSHDLFDANFRSLAVISHHAATHIALSDDADQLETFCILNHRRATTT